MRTGGRAAAGVRPALRSGHASQHVGEDPDLAGVVCPRCGNDDMLIEHDAPEDEADLLA